MSLIAGRGCRWPPRRDSVSPCAPLSGGRDTHDGHENSPILVFFSNLLVEADADGFISQRCPVCRSLATRRVLEERLREARREDGVTVRD